MTRIALISDIHNELLRKADSLVPDIQIAQSADILVLAGDIDNGEFGAVYAVQQSERLGIPVIYVPGNHEFYGVNPATALRRMQEVTAGTNVNVLHRDAITINQTRFIGATLWTDFTLLGDDKKGSVINYARERLNDFKEIQALTPETMTEWHRADLDFLNSEMAKPFNGKTVVITHHAPLMRCLPELERRELKSACYANNLDSFIKKYKPSAWLYGHIHWPVKIQEGQTQIANNAAGYPVVSSRVRPYVPMMIELCESP